MPDWHSCSDCCRRFLLIFPSEITAFMIGFVSLLHNQRAGAGRFGAPLSVGLIVVTNLLPDDLAKSYRSNEAVPE